MKTAIISVLGFALSASAKEVWTTPEHLQHEARARTAAVKQVNQERHLQKRQLPASVSNYTTIQSGSATVRYKRIDDLGCETTPGVGSYAGYVDINNSSTFFYFFEARNNASTAPITMWTNGGPGSDSAIGLFQELGPCSIDENLTPVNNPYAWNTYSNMLFISQPPGVGFSYVTKEDGSLSDDYAGVLTQSEGVDGRFPTANRYINTTDLAAVSAWAVIQGFYANLDSLDNRTDSKSFNLATESYGGHYGPAFFSYFYDQNEAIKNGTAQGIPLQMDSLLIINGIIDEYIQAPYYPVMATNNTYGIVAYNETVRNYAEFALNMDNGCLQQIEICRSVDISVFSGQSICAEAANMCRDNVEGVYYAYGGRGVYDIRHPINDPTPPEYFADFLNLPSTQQILGVDLNYTEANSDIYFYFQNTGDFVYNEFLTDLQNILDNGVRVSLIYGDADYICNWYGGEAISKSLNYSGSADFASAGYTAMTVNGTQYGETRQAGNFSFTRVYEAGHEVPYYAPEAALALFQRSIMGLSASDGSALTASTISSGTANTTHTESLVPLPSTTMDSGASGSASGAASASAVTSVAPYFKERRRVF